MKLQIVSQPVIKQLSDALSIENIVFKAACIAETDFK